MCRTTLRLAIAFSVLFAAASANAITSTPRWEPRELVAEGAGDISRHEGADSILAYDHHGSPGIAFYDSTGGDLRYARRLPVVGWHCQTIDASFVTGQYPSLAFDRYERPAIGYFADTNDNLKFAHFDGAAWNVELVDTPGFVGYHTSLAFDAWGRAGLAYRDGSNSSLKYVYDSDGDFSLDDETPFTAVNDANEGWWASLAFDPLGRAMIAHGDETAGSLRFTINDPTVGWITTTVDSDGAAGFYPSIGIDPDSGYPSIAYFSFADKDLRYAEWDGTDWAISTIDADGDTGFHPSLAFDPADGNPAIAYRDATEQALKMAWHDGNQWNIQTVDAVGDVGYTPSLAFDDYGTGYPSIAYFEAGTNNLYFIEDPPAMPEPGTAIFVLSGALMLILRRRMRRAY